MVSIVDGDNGGDDVALELRTASAAHLYGSEPGSERSEAYTKAAELAREHGRGLQGHR